MLFEIIHQLIAIAGSTATESGEGLLADFIELHDQLFYLGDKRRKMRAQIKGGVKNLTLKSYIFCSLEDFYVKALNHY
jgi:hypothetical protein